MKINSLAVVEVAAALPFNQGAPRINGPTVYGASPKRDFLYYIPVRGERPLKWSVIGELPPGLTLNGDSCVISGKAEEAGIWKVTLQVSNRLGTDTRPFRIEIAENHLALTPMLGWTSWNAHSIHVTGALIRRAADLLCSTGLREFGYSFVNTDSCWQGHRPSKFSALVPNERFPEMGAMVDYIHRKGLKAGIYSTPMVVAWGSNDYQPALPGSTGYPLNPDAFQEFFGGCGKTHFEEYDARQFAEWKFDYLKYDWPMCDPYYTEYMSKALRATGRDFIYCLTTQVDLLLPDLRQYVPRTDRHHGPVGRPNRRLYVPHQRMAGFQRPRPLAGLGYAGVGRCFRHHQVHRKPFDGKRKDHAHGSLGIYGISAAALLRSGEY